MNNSFKYTDEELREDVEKTIGIRAKDIEKIQFCGCGI